METVHAHPRLGVYTGRDPFGAGGDFTTAPEISQMFGELIGLWSAVVWQAMGRPDPVALVELGPGRGTLIADALRAAHGVAPFRAAVRLHLVETSRRLRDRQGEALAQAGLDREPVWHDTLAEVPDGALLAVANEFFDALPVRQFQQTEQGWRERLVGIDGAGGGFGFVLAPSAAARTLVPPSLGHAPPDTVFEVSPTAIAIAHALGGRLTRCGGAALIVDYGYAEGATGGDPPGGPPPSLPRPPDRSGDGRYHGPRGLRRPRPGGGRRRRRRPWTRAPGGLPGEPGNLGAHRGAARRRHA